MTDQKDKILNKAKIGLMTTPDSIFLSTILFSLNQIWDSGTKTASTNGADLKINPDFFATLDPKERIFLLAHESWHVAFQHMSRGKNYEHERYNKAADYVINLMLVKAGFKMPKGGLLDYQYQDMHTEAVYKLLPEEPAGGSGYDCDIKKITDDPKSDKDGKTAEDKAMEVAGIVMKAATHAKMQGERPGSIPGEVAVALDDLINPVLPWYVILQNFMSQFAKEDYTYSRPNKRYAPEFYLPTQHSESLVDLVVARDLSYSVTDEEIIGINSEIEDIRETLNPRKITVIDFDTSIRSINELDRDTSITSIETTGRGGTSLFPVFKYLKNDPPTVLIVFSDLWCTAVEDNPGYPVVWIAVNNKKAQVNFGELIHYEV